MPRWLCLFALVACNGSDDEAPPADPIEEGCFRIEDGVPTDAGATADAAKTLTVGPDPHLVGLYPDQVSYVSVTTGGGTVVLMSDTPDVFTSIETDGEAFDLPTITENPTCPQDLPSVLEASLPSGTHIIGLGPSYKATVWLLVDEK